MEKTQIALTVNGEPHDVAFEPYKTLLEVLREDLNLCGTKHGCELGECGACAVLLDGRPVLSCLVLGVECGGREVVTVEGLATERTHTVNARAVGGIFGVHGAGTEATAGLTAPESTKAFH